MKVNIRVAVAVDRDGKYSACGWCTDDASMVESAIEGLDAAEWRTAWIEAEVDVNFDVPVVTGAQVAT